jgi:tRNA threonylcarbamoyl adenosine modification protein (Sua5/YciO/YrdC/YwlC family)
MPEIANWRTADPDQLVERASAALLAGRLVVFPTETVYGVAAYAGDPNSAERLQSSKSRQASKPLALAIGVRDSVLDWLPDLGRIGRRLARRSWPGPLTLVSDEGLERGRAARLPASIRRGVSPEGSIGLRMPRHEAIQAVLAATGPLLLTSANPSGGPEPTTAADLELAQERDLDLVIDDGPTALGKPSSVVRVHGTEWEVLREGALDRKSLTRLAGCWVLFVCTGNTCRSALAEGLFKKMLAERLGCTVEELPDRGFTIRSAGLAAFGGYPAPPEAAEVARQRGADLSTHRSRMISEEMVRQSDFILVMTRSHLDLLDDLFGIDREFKPRLLCPEGSEIADPVGCEQSVYSGCMAQIERALQQLLPEVLKS